MIEIKLDAPPYENACVSIKQNCTEQEIQLSKAQAYQLSEMLKGLSIAWGYSK